MNKVCAQTSRPEHLYLGKANFIFYFWAAFVQILANLRRKTFPLIILARFPGSDLIG